MEIDDPRKWRISKSGLSIKTGWSDEKKLIAKYPGGTAPLDITEFQEWLDNAQIICKLHNAELEAAVAGFIPTGSSTPNAELCKQLSEDAAAMLTRLRGKEERFKMHDPDGQKYAGEKGETL